MSSDLGACENHLICGMHDRVCIDDNGKLFQMRVRKKINTQRGQPGEHCNQVLVLVKII